MCGLNLFCAISFLALALPLAAGPAQRARGGLIKPQFERSEFAAPDQVKPLLKKPILHEPERELPTREAARVATRAPAKAIRENVRLESWFHRPSVGKLESDFPNRVLHRHPRYQE